MSFTTNEDPADESFVIESPDDLFTSLHHPLSLDVIVLYRLLVNHRRLLYGLQPSLRHPQSMSLAILVKSVLLFG